MAKFQVEGRIFDTERAAAAWLLLNGHPLPPDLAGLESDSGLTQKECDCYEEEGR